MPDALNISGINYPDSENALSEMLSTHEGRNTLAKELSTANEKLASGEAKLRWRYVKRPDYLLGEIADLDRPKLTYPLPDYVSVPKESFITQDEIDAILTRGSGVSQG